MYREGAFDRLVPICTALYADSSSPSYYGGGDTEGLRYYIIVYISEKPSQNGELFVSDSFSLE